MTAYKSFILALLLTLLIGCDKEDVAPFDSNLTIFIINDQHAQIDNFSKVKHIIDIEREETNVLVTCAGDLFSGNPVVDNYAPKGYPMVDLMNKVGFDIAVLGNHEFDYGQAVLAERMQQSEFKWVCANIDMANSGIPQPYDYITISIGDMKITFLGLIETKGKPGATIPSTHPLKIQGILFEKPEDVVSQYANVKVKENADLYIALTHLGHNYHDALGDFQLAQQYPYFDIIIGGHSSQIINTVVSGTPVFQAGEYLEYLGKIELQVKDKKVSKYNFELIDLANYPYSDNELQADIDDYNNIMNNTMSEVIGISLVHHEIYQLGCFYTDAIRERLGVDITFQNYGGIRSEIDAGNITVREIYEIDPFNNGAIIYQMSVAEIKNFLMASESWLWYSGVEIVQVDHEIQILDLFGNVIPDATILSVGINDYIPAVYDTYFPSDGDIQSFTTAEAIIYYLNNMQNEVNYPDCDRSFKFQ